MEFKWVFTAMGAIFCTLLLSFMNEDYQDAQVQVRAMEMGYEQCQEVSITSSDYKEIIWKKECK